MDADSSAASVPTSPARPSRASASTARCCWRPGSSRPTGFAAVSSGDNSNILAARVVRETFGVENVVARIYDPGRAEVYERLGIPTVATVRWTADQVLRRLLPAGSEPQWRDPSGSVRLMEVHVDRAWVGRTVAADRGGTGARVPFIFRMGSGMVPKQSTIFQDGDLLYAAVLDARLAKVEAVLAAPPPSRMTRTGGLRCG